MTFQEEEMITGGTPDVAMEDTNMEGYTSNRKSRSTEDNTTEQTHSGQEETSETESPEKKPYGAHGIIRETTDQRMDFPNARNTGEVY